ncbi:sugar kinase [Actinomadura darangshiensis]|uniref:sugar kinase n=1 Tax=Actinomadura darangshiensis TaxID=705336 RepID=UPI001FB77D62|nr:sugar kinase [Actinomadura darangshiensis]
MISSSARRSDRDVGGAAPAVVTLGEAMCVLQAEHIGPVRHNRSVRLGMSGAETNVAIGVRRLGVPSAWIGRVGEDPMGEIIAGELRAEGVDVTALRTDGAAPTGLMVKERRTSKVSRVFYVRSGSAGSRLSPDDVSRELVEGARALHITGITLALSESARAAVHHAIGIARDAGVLVSFDVNHRTGLWSAEEAVEHYRATAMLADVVFASHDEARMLVGDLGAAASAAAMGGLGPEQVVIKQGELGFTARIHGREYAAPAVAVPVVDPVGAGDAFVAGYLASLVRGEPPEAALRTANALGAFAVSVPGDWEGLPSVAELPLVGPLDDPVLR